MKIVLLEELNVSDDYIKKYIDKLEDMGHNFIAYKKDTDINKQIERVKDADVLMLANMPLDRRVVENASKLKYIDVAFTGVDHIPVSYAKTRGINISNASDYATDAVSELCISFMIELLRNIKENEESLRNGGTKEGFVGNLLRGKTVGIIGAGKIGRRVAYLCKVFGCRVIVYNRSIVKEDFIDEQVELDELLKESDIVSLHCPLTDDTKGMIGKDELSLMKNSAILINTARGAIVNTDDLVFALNNNIIRGAAIDVYEKEPPLDKDYPLLKAKNVILTPHMGFSSLESMEKRADIVFDNLFSFLDGNWKNRV